MSLPHKGSNDLTTQESKRICEIIRKKLAHKITKRIEGDLESGKISKEDMGLSEYGIGDDLKLLAEVAAMVAINTAAAARDVANHAAASAILVDAFRKNMNSEAEEEE